ncbi:MAG: photosynthetic reaction center subunit H [Xanthomonadales bacterium]|nr:photosynthetic reaction center subunit H [Xanthomonadales bacterium]
METGALTANLDVAQIVLYLFWFFFLGLILYIRREDRREGYPLEDERGVRKKQGLLFFPEPKTFVSFDGSTVNKPDGLRDTREINGEPVAGFPGAPLAPTGDPMQAGIGPGSYAERANVPDVTPHGDNRIVPFRVDSSFSVAPQDPDPRGMSTIGADGKAGGQVVDIWVDRCEHMIRYLEVEVPGDTGSKRVLLPINFAKVGGESVKVESIYSHQFGGVPGLGNPDQVTRYEEERVVAYYGAGTLYADRKRQEPLF